MHAVGKAVVGAVYGKDQEFSFGHAEFYIDVEHVVGWMMNGENRRYNGHIDDT